MGQIKAVLFDFDGVIVDSLRLDFEVRKSVFAEYGVNFSVRDFVDFYVSPSSSTAAQTALFLESKGSHANVSEVKAKRKELFEKSIGKLTLVPGFLVLARMLKKRGLRLAVVSANNRSTIKLAMSRHGLNDFFDFIIGVEDCPIIKPSPAPYLLAVEKLGLPASQVLVFEDSDKGVQSAKSAGCKCIALLNDFTKSGDFSKADLVAKSLREITPKKLKRF